MVVILVILTISCDITKKASKTKTDTDFKENIETSRKRIGDTVTYKNVLHVKDTTIYTVNRQGTTLKTVYDTEGKLVQADCFASAIEELTRINREMQQTIKDKDKEKEEKFNTDWILYIVAGIAVIFMFFFFLLFRSINANSKILALVAEKLK